MSDRRSRSFAAPWKRAPPPAGEVGCGGGRGGSICTKKGRAHWVHKTWVHKTNAPISSSLASRNFHQSWRTVLTAHCGMRTSKLCYGVETLDVFEFCKLCFGTCRTKLSFLSSLCTTTVILQLCGHKTSHLAEMGSHQKGFLFNHTTPFPAEGIEKSCGVTGAIFVQCENHALVRANISRHHKQNTADVSVSCFYCCTTVVKWRPTSKFSTWKHQ